MIDFKASLLNWTSLLLPHFTSCNSIEIQGKLSKRIVQKLLYNLKKHTFLYEIIVMKANCFDLNACDALLHSCQKRKLRSYPAPLCREHIERDFKRMVRAISTPRMLQRWFYRAYRRDLNGDIDKSLIPLDILDFYANSADEDDTVCEEESDVEYDDLEISDGEFDSNWYSSNATLYVFMYIQLIYNWSLILTAPDLIKKLDLMYG